MRAAAVQLELDERQGPQPRGGGPAHARGRGRRRRPGGAAREVQRHRRARRLRRGRRDARRPHHHVGARRRRASSASTSWQAPSSRSARAATSSATPACTSAPTARCKAVYRKIHMFDVVVGGSRVPGVGVRGPRRRDRALARPARRRPTRPHRLLRPALPRAVPDPRRARRAHRHAAGRLHACPPARRTGRSSCAPARSRTRRSWSPPTSSARTCPARRATAAR